MSSSTEASRILGQRVLQHRLAWALSQMDAAHLAGLNVAHYGRVERGEGNPSLDTLVRIAGAFGLDPAELVRGITVEQLGESKSTFTARDFVQERKARSH
jgi:transcriptional regulator with XRE-family HTH domain